MEITNAYNEIPQNWNFYFTRIEDQPASIRLNLALGQIAPLEQFPNRVFIRFKMTDPDENGLGSDKEYERLCKIEDFLDETLSGKPCLLAGTIRSNGYFELCYYTEEGFHLPQFISEELPKIGENNFDSDENEDLEWDTYFNFLYPSPYERHTIYNMEICNHLEENGDDGLTPREVQFWAYFDTENEAQSFSKKAQAVGYSEDYCGILERDEEDEEAENEPDVYQVILSKTTDVEWRTANEFCWELMQLAQEYNGTYDGWETLLVKK